MRHIWCPACGWFGRKARRRNADAEAQAHITWASMLARESRSRRSDADEPVAVAECRTIRHPYPALTLHSHVADVPCDDSCSTSPAGYSETVIFPPVSSERLAEADAAVRRLFR